MDENNIERLAKNFTEKISKPSITMAFFQAMQQLYPQNTEQELVESMILMAAKHEEKFKGMLETEEIGYMFH